MDDFLVYGNDFECALNNLKKFIIRCLETNLALSDAKCFMMQIEGIVLGHHVSHVGLKVDPTKMEIILNFPIPSNKRDVRYFQGYARYYHRFIKKFSKIALPLFKLLVKDVELFWSINFKFYFQTLKENILSAPILKGPYLSLPLYISTDAFDTTMGARLGKKGNLLTNFICFINKKLTRDELNYTTTKKEMLAVVHAISKF